MNPHNSKKNMIKGLRKSISLTLIAAFVGSSLYMPQAQAGEMVMLRMPVPGSMVHLSPEYTPAHLQGITIHPDNALQFDFLIHKGEGNLDNKQKKEEYTKLVKYFLASLTIPDEDQWVNLSPYERNRIIKDDFGKTEMGRDLLTQDYLLKQITSSLMYPESGLGKKFWDRVYERAQKEYGSTNIPVNTFNKVWITPDEAIVYESGNTAYIVKSHLKVMLEEDYLSLAKHSAILSSPNASVGDPAHAGSGFPIKTFGNDSHSLASKIVKQLILPEIEKEVNEGKNFAMLRQIYSGMVLATWYKRALKESLLGKVYADKAKVKGVDQDPKSNEAIYKKYLTAFKKGVFNYIKEDVDTYSQQVIPRKYFAGGWAPNPEAIHAKLVTPAQLVETVGKDSPNEDDARVNFNPTKETTINAAMTVVQGKMVTFERSGISKHVSKEYTAAEVREHIQYLLKNDLPRLNSLSIIEIGNGEWMVKYLAFLNDILQAFVGTHRERLEESTGVTVEVRYYDRIGGTHWTGLNLSGEGSSNFFKGEFFKTSGPKELRQAVTEDVTREIRREDMDDTAWMEHALNDIYLIYKLYHLTGKISEIFNKVQRAVLDLDQTRQYNQEAINLLYPNKSLQERRAALTDFLIKVTIGNEEKDDIKWLNEQVISRGLIKDILMEILAKRGQAKRFLPSSKWIGEKERFKRELEKETLDIWKPGEIFNWLKEKGYIQEDDKGNVQSMEMTPLMQLNLHRKFWARGPRIQDLLQYPPELKVRDIVEAIFPQTPRMTARKNGTEVVKTELAKWVDQVLNGLDTDTPVVDLPGVVMRTIPVLRDAQGAEYAGKQALDQIPQIMAQNPVRHAQGFWYLAYSSDFAKSLLAGYYAAEPTAILGVKRFGDGFNSQQENAYPLVNQEADRFKTWLKGIAEQLSDLRVGPVNAAMTVREAYRNAFGPAVTLLGVYATKTAISMIAAKDPNVLHTLFNHPELWSFVLIGPGVSTVGLTATWAAWGKVDRASIADTPLGGIDLNSANLAMTIKRDGKGVPLPFAQQDMAQLSRIQGFVPDIIEIRPVTPLLIRKEMAGAS